MKKRKLLLLALLLCAAFAHAATSTLTGTLKDSFGTGINGTLLMYLPVPAMDLDTNVAVAPIPVTFRLVNGVISGGAPLYDVTRLQPASLYYTARAYDTTGTLVFYGNYSVSGGTFNLGAAIPTTITTSNISYAGVGFTTLNNTWTGSNIFKSLDNVLFADQFASVQAAINTLPAGGGTVLLSCNTSYTGPTTFPQGTRLASLCPKAYSTSLSYSSSQIVTGSNLVFEGIGFNMTGSAALTFNSLVQSKIDANVVCVTGSPCVKFDASSGNAVQNVIDFLTITTGGNIGLQLNGTVNAVTDNHFRTVIVNMTRASLGAITEAVGFTQNCDSNKFDSLHMFFTNVNAGNGIVFNDSGTPSSDTDADNIAIGLMDFTSGVAITGTAITVNKSQGNWFVEGFGDTGATFTSTIATDSTTKFTRFVMDGAGLYLGKSGLIAPAGTPVQSISLPDTGGNATASVAQSQICGATTACAATNEVNVKIVHGGLALSGGTATITGFSPAFTSTTSYNCTATDNSAASAVKVTNVSGSSISLAGTGTDIVSYICVGT